MHKLADWVQLVNPLTVLSVEAIMIASEGVKGSVGKINLHSTEI